MAMFRHTAEKRARILTKAEFKHALRVASATREPERNQLLLCLSHALGLRVTEMARITVDDVLLPSGRIRTELACRAEITKGGRPRTVPLSSATLLTRLNTYLDFRVRRGIGTTLDCPEYRGLLPHQPLIYSNRGGGFSLTLKRRLLETGVIEDYRACDGLEAWFRDFYPKAGLRGATSHSGRRSFGTRLLESGVDVEDVSRLLGHSDLDFSRPYLQVSQESIRHAYSVAISESNSLGIIGETPYLSDGKRLSRKPPAPAKRAAVIAQVEPTPITPTNERKMFRRSMATKIDKNSILAESSPIGTEKICGVYFLLSPRGDVVYVGQSTHVVRRLADHLGDPRIAKEFSHASYLDIPEAALSPMEDLLIKAFQPKLNRAGR